MKLHENSYNPNGRCKSDGFSQITPYKHAIFTSDVFEMENTIRTLMQSRSCYHNTLARLKDERTMNTVQFNIQMKITHKRCLCDGKHHPKDNSLVSFLSQDPGTAKG